MALDTSVASLLIGPRAATSGYPDVVRGYGLALPMATYAELQQGSLIDGWGGVKLQDLDNFVLGTTLLPVTETTAELWASLRFECRGRGIGNTENDAWIAATALEVGCPLVSHDRDHLRMQAAVPDLQVLSLLAP